MESIKEFIPSLLSSVLGTRSIIEKVLQGPLETSRKADGSFVTQIDKIVSVYLLNLLANITPSIPVLCEEAGGNFVVNQSNCFWLVDPIDGTKHLQTGDGQYTVNLGLVRKISEVYQAFVGIVYHPTSNTIYWCDGISSWTQQAHENPVRLSMRIKKPRAEILIGSPKDKSESLLSHFPSNPNFITLGSSLKFCCLAKGLADGYVRARPSSEWDTAAGHAIVKGAGGEVYTENGLELTYGKPGWVNPSFYVK